MLTGSFGLMLLARTLWQLPSHGSLALIQRPRKSYCCSSTTFLFLAFVVGAGPQWRHGSSYNGVSLRGAFTVPPALTDMRIGQQ